MSQPLPLDLTSTCGSRLRPWRPMSGAPQEVALPAIHQLDGATIRPVGGPELVGADELVSHVLVVELGARIVLVDTGIGLADIAAPAERLGTEFCEQSGPVLDPERTVARQLLSLGLECGQV